MGRPRGGRAHGRHRTDRHARRGLDGEPDQNCPHHVEACEHLEVRRETKMIRHTRRDETADQVTRNIAGDVGGERRRRVALDRMIAHISERERESRRHAQPLNDPERGEYRQGRQQAKQQCRDGKQTETDENPKAAIDTRAKQRYTEASGRHTDGTGIYGKTHRRRTDAVGRGQKRQQRLGGEQIHEGEKRRRGDHGETDRSGGGPTGVVALELTYGHARTFGQWASDAMTRLARGRYTRRVAAAATSYQGRHPSPCGRDRTTTAPRVPGPNSSTNATSCAVQVKFHRLCARSAPRNRWRIPRPRPR